MIFFFFFFFFFSPSFSSWDYCLDLLLDRFFLSCSPFSLRSSSSFHLFSYFFFFFFFFFFFVFFFIFFFFFFFCTRPPLPFPSSSPACPSSSSSRGLLILWRRVSRALSGAFPVNRGDLEAATSLLSVSIGGNLENCQSELKTWRRTAPVMCQMMGVRPAQQFREVRRYSHFIFCFDFC